MFFFFSITSLIVYISFIYLYTNKNPAYLVLSLVILFVTGSIILLMFGVNFLPFIFVVACLYCIFWIFLTIFVSNTNFYYYILSFIVLLIVSCVWLFMHLDNKTFLFYGYFCMGLCFLFLIQMQYPKSLKKLKYPKLTSLLFKYKQQISRIVLSLLCLAFVFPTGIPILASLLVNYGYWLLTIPAFIFVMSWLIIISLIFILGSLQFNNKFPKWTSKQKKLFLFLAKNPKSLQDPFVLLLFCISFLNTITPLVFLVFGLSFRYHNGVEIYLYTWLCINLSFVVTLPFVRCYIKNQYNDNSLRILVWNGPEVNTAKVLGAGFLSAASALLFGAVNREISRRDTELDYELERRQRAKLNKEVDELRLKDPQGAATNKYPYYGPNDPLPKPTKHVNVGKSGQILIK